MVFGSEIENRYEVWNCSDTEECQGACVATLVMTQDVRSASAFAPLLTPRRSVITDVRLINRVDDQIQEVSALSVRTAVEFEIEGAVDLTSYILEVSARSL